jgi:hypothetical protein
LSVMRRLTLTVAPSSPPFFAPYCCERPGEERVVGQSLRARERGRVHGCLKLPLALIPRADVHDTGSEAD